MIDPTAAITWQSFRVTRPLDGEGRANPEEANAEEDLCARDCAMHRAIDLLAGDIDFSCPTSTETSRSAAQTVDTIGDAWGCRLDLARCQQVLQRAADLTPVQGVKDCLHDAMLFTELARRTFARDQIHA